MMAGIDLITIMNMGGWKSLRMVQRYSSVSVDHARISLLVLFGQPPNAQVEANREA